MKWFKSKLRKRIEFYIEMMRDSIKSLRQELITRNIKQTLDPAEHAKIIVQIKDNEDDIELLNEILK